MIEAQARQAAVEQAHPQQVVEARADFKGANPLSGADQRGLLVSHVDQGLLDLAVGRGSASRVALQLKPRPERLQRAIGAAPPLKSRRAKRVGGGGVTHDCTFSQISILGAMGGLVFSSMRPRLTLSSNLSCL